MLQRLIFCLLCPALLVLTACQGYDFKVNDTVVYTPARLFDNYSVPDDALRTCLEQAIKDASITRPEQLTVLNCSHAGIESLDGLATFSALKALRLSENNIRNLVEINKILALEELYLNNNRVVDPVPLYQLPALNQLDLSGNKALQCPRPGALQQVGILILPEQCLRGG